MILVDRALEARASEGHPLRVGVIGAGFMGRGIANQIVNSVRGMELAAICNRNVDKARQACRYAGVDDPVLVEDAAGLDRECSRGRCTITENPSALARSACLDALIEVTGTVEFAARVVLEAIEHGKHVILMNAELDGTLGPILKRRADRAGVVLSACDGDQPGVQMNLYRFVRGIGLTPLICGNIKGLQDCYRNPTTQEAFARTWDQQPHMVTSFADGTKISFEQATVANATGMRVAQRGMLGHHFDGHVDDMTDLYDIARLRDWGGIVDYVVGAKPAPGVFVFASHDDPKQRRYLDLYKLGPGPLYSFYTPYHLCHFEVPNSVARAVLFGDAVMVPLGAPRVEVVATAKVELEAGAVLDGIGFYMTYGQCENAATAREERLLPMGVAEGCRVRRDLPRDHVLTYDDVDLPEGRLVDRLRAEQAAHFDTS